MSGNAFPAPTIAGFQVFLQEVVGVLPAYLPVSPVPYVVTFVYNLCARLVNKALWSTGTYTPAYYNLGASLIINLAQDQPGMNYFNKLRAQLNIGTGFRAGVVVATSDESTSVNLANPEWAKNLTIGDLQRLQDPFGQMYLSLAQDYGPTVWELV